LPVISPDPSRKAPPDLSPFEAQRGRRIHATSSGWRNRVIESEIDSSVASIVGFVLSNALGSSPQTLLFSHHAFAGAVHKLPIINLRFREEL